MKRVSLLVKVAFLAASTAFLASCDATEEDEPTPTVVSQDSCDVAVYPTSTGGATIGLENFDENSVIMVSAGSELTLAVEVTRGADERAKKIRLFQSACANIKGDEVDLSDQPKGGRNGIDLRRTDDVQLRNVIYKVPAMGFSDIFLTIQVDEGSNLETYKQLTLKVAGSGVIDTWSNVTLGGNTNAAASRMSSGTGQSYTACNAAANIDYIDITYAVSLETGSADYICSNPARFVSPVGLSAATANCGDDGALPTDGGTETFFAVVPSTINFEAATNADIQGLSITNTNAQYIEVLEAGQVIAFMNTSAAGGTAKKGLIKIESVTAGSTAFNGSVQVSVKVLR